MEPGTSNMEQGISIIVRKLQHGAWICNMESGTCNLELGNCNLEPGIFNMELGICKQSQETAAWSLEPAMGEPGTCNLELGNCNLESGWI